MGRKQHFVIFVVLHNFPNIIVCGIKRFIYWQYICSNYFFVAFSALFTDSTYVVLVRGIKRFFLLTICSTCLWHLNDSFQWRCVILVWGIFRFVLLTMCSIYLWYLMLCFTLFKYLSMVWACAHKLVAQNKVRGLWFYVKILIYLYYNEHATETHNDSLFFTNPQKIGNEVPGVLFSTTYINILSIVLKIHFSFFVIFHNDF